MTTEIILDPNQLADALAGAGLDPDLRGELFDLLRRAEGRSNDPEMFKESVRWPLILAALRDAGTHRVVLADGVIFEASPDSRIEKALLLSSDLHPDHVWEPQTTKLLVALAKAASNVVVGGAYIGDHVLPLAKATTRSGVVHAFEPMEHAFNRLLRNLELNDIKNVIPQRFGLWDTTEVPLRVEGHLALASSVPAADADGGEAVMSVALSDYVERQGLPGVDLIMLDVEGGEEKALLGALDLLEAPKGRAPNVVFEMHRAFVDWSDGLAKTSIVRLLHDCGYHVYAIRDIHDNYPMDGQPIEVIPADDVHLLGPPHGFNMLAVKDVTLIDTLGLHIVKGVSPKLIPAKDPALHHPIGGFRKEP